KLNGTYCAENGTLLAKILKEEWGHEGLVVTDWGAMDRRVEGLDAGTELEMPGGNRGNDERIVAAVKNGELDEAVLDRAVERLLILISKSNEALVEERHYDRQVHHALARRVAGEGAVLLKNDDAILPLPESAHVALIGQFAKTPRYQGAGSSLMNPTRLDNLYDEIVKLVGEERLAYAPGYSITEAGRVDDALIAEAVAVARDAEVVVVCAGLTELYEVEGLDRTHMNLPASHDALIEAVAVANPNVVVVLSNGSPVAMPWVERVKAILEGYLGGQAGAGGLADILYGKANPSGKLAETFPIRLEDTPSYHYFPGGPKTVEYRESLYVGYRYYDTAEQDVLFPFGHGLSYTTFAYRDLTLDRNRISDHDALTVTVTVKNSGTVAGQEIVQLYVRDVESTAFRPAQELKGFAKVALEPGAETLVRFELNRRAFAYFNTDLDDWHVESGDFEIRVGASSRDIRLSATVNVASTQAPAPAVDRTGIAAYYDLKTAWPISKAHFEALLGRPVPDNAIARDELFTINTPVCDMQRSLVGRLLYSFMQRQVMAMAQGAEGPTALVMEATACEGPLRLMLMASGGAVSREMLEALLLMINGRFFKGLFALLRARRGNKK
ncbi:MAG: glycoside hydrolase family 3 C-terminal domain-containing protein, partial [Anaerolineae bacterium]|nr:glycoside hydrolase family 3 C-terminal domain-containing protein [Anaerolineae bacterium]